MSPFFLTHPSFNDARYGRSGPSQRATHRQAPKTGASEIVLCRGQAIGTADELTHEVFISAVRLYRDAHWEFAFERLTGLADQGHAPAAKLVLLMLRYGAALYGTSFAARPEQIARWAQQVLRQSRVANARGANVFVE